MLTITHSSSVQNAKRYFRQGFIREGYFFKDLEVTGEWGGRAAGKLGLSGIVRGADYFNLCDNLHPETGEKLTARMKANRRVYYDFTWGVPKSVTLAYMWTKDERILKVILAGVRETMQDVERDMATRVRTKGKNEDRITGNWVHATFVHFAARPVDGVPDPHLHVHCPVFNLTFDEEEGRFKAGQFHDILLDREYYQALCLSRWAHGLRELGYEIEPNGKYFEIGGISRSLIEKFSRRGEQVEAEAKRRGITSPMEKARLAAVTREKKPKSLSMPEFETQLWRRLTPQDQHELDGLRAPLMRAPAAKAERRERSSVELGNKAKGYWPTNLTGEGFKSRAEEQFGVMPAEFEAVDYAIKHLFFTRSVVSERELITEALNWGHGRVSLQGIKEAVREFPLRRIQEGRETQLMTADVILEETRITDRCKAGRFKFPALNAHWRIQSPILNHQQKTAVFHVLTSRDLVTAIIGKAGVGKTATLQEIAQAIEAGGGKVLAFAPSAIASRKTLREQGFPDADTVQRLIANPYLQEKARGAVWFVDEAGLMSSKATDRLLAMADLLDARVVVVGDTRQHHSVERGDALRLMQNFGEVSCVTIDIIQRQTGLYKKAVELISKREFPESFQVLRQMNAFREIADREERYTAIAEDYVATLKRGKSVLLVAPTHAECDIVTEKVRAALKQNGTLGEARRWSILRNMSWSPGQKGYGSNYAPGLVVMATGHLAGFSLGEEMEVVEASRRGVRVCGEDGKTKNLPLDQAEKFNVYSRDQIEICKGDRIRITSNSRSKDRHPLHNGSYYSVKGFDKNGDMIFDNGWCVGKEFNHVDYGYARTSHAAQSTTVEVILVAQSGTISMGASDTNQFYATVSRGSNEVRIYTDDIAGLQESVARVRERRLATEVISASHQGMEMSM